MKGIREIIKPSKVLPWLFLLSPLLFVAARITLFNPLWRIETRFPEAEVQIYTVNSPDFYFWPSVARMFGIRMDDPDRSVRVCLDSYPDPVSLDDFKGAGEVVLKNCKVTDISFYWHPSSGMSSAYFESCEFSGLPAEQMQFLSPGKNVPDSYYIPYQVKQNPPAPR